jgi:glycerol-1-phosphate dehydrogenase [NAD(P)+]
VLHQPGTVTDDEFLTVLAESLVLSGIAMTVAGSSRPGSGGDHEILHAIDQLYPGTGSHGELAGLGALFCTYLHGDERLFALMSACLSRHGLPRLPADIGLGPAEFTQAVLYAPATRPGRYTILERLELDEAAIAQQVAGFTAAVTSGG